MLPAKLKRIFANPENRDLLLNSALAFVVRIFGALAGFIATFFIARTLGAEESGLYFLAFSLLTILAAVSRVGMDNTLIRFVGSGPEQGLSVLLKGIVVSAAVSSFAAAVVFFLADFLSRSVFDKPTVAPVLRFISVGIVGLSLLTLAANALQGLRRVTSSIFTLNIAVNLGLVVAVVFFPVNQAVSLAGVYAGASLVVGLLGVVLCLVFQPPQSGVQVAWGVVWKSCLPLWAVVIMSQLVQWSGQFIAGAYVSSDLVAQLAVAQRTAMLASFVLIAVNLVVAPRFAALHRQGSKAGMQRLAINSVKLISLMALPVVGVMLVFPAFLMGLFGEGFGGGARLLQILAVGQFVNAMTGSVGYLLMMSGHERDMRNVTLISGTLALSLTWVLTVYFGATGNAVGTAVAVATQNLLAVYFVKKRLGFNTLAVWR
ncbi:oligosaccharide flippase family protein [Spongiibacter nanhainus]|uniref:Oligosaccharide flippase family protein n=1 Tax=Spongiibacter nanhainus TaxID=2794344 RepID=A0A7T4R392_9GAMM|nr:oligosaccharide flippase family protein [Spongiibacter nanhainus]QQD19444.1 oligosaccharide flippase family protein [Spongiibacter nanhainus]